MTYCQARPEAHSAGYVLFSHETTHVAILVLGLSHRPRTHEHFTPRNTINPTALTKFCVYLCNSSSNPRTCSDGQFSNTR
jgi:hypothetical protein